MSALQQESEIVLRDGWAWPREDGVAFEHIQMYLPLLRMAARQATRRRVAIQAGGNAGVHPVELAAMFDRVITFEPERLNFRCLEMNAEKFGNIEAHCGILGDSVTPVGLKRVQGMRDGELCENTGAWKVVDENEGVPQQRIDDLNLKHLDFIQLDVEGYELKVLQGGEKTIKRCSPVIMVEVMDHGEDPRPFLEDLEYHRIIKGDFDHVYVRNNGTPDLR
jgi:FkbM family methyltransferase